MKPSSIRPKSKHGAFFPWHPLTPRGQAATDPVPGKTPPDTLAMIQSLSRIATALQSLKTEARERDPKRLFRVVSTN